MSETLTADGQRTILLNTPHLDWLTLTSFDRRLEAYGLELMRTMPQTSKQKFVLRRGYSGVEGNAVSVASGTQKGHMHYLVTVSGEHCFRLDLDYLPPNEVISCTRLDACISIIEPLNFTMRGLYHILSQPQSYNWRGSGPAPAVSWFESATGSTIYIGSTKSEKRARLYQKDTQEGPVLRLEVQMRGHQADDAYRQIAEKGEAVIGGIIGGLLARWPNEANDWSIRFNSVLDGTGEYTTEAAVSDAKSRIEWLRRCVMPAFRTALAGRYKEEAFKLWVETIHMTGEGYGGFEERPLTAKDWQPTLKDAMDGVAQYLAMHAWKLAARKGGRSPRWVDCIESARLELLEAVKETMTEEQREKARSKC